MENYKSCATKPLTFFARIVHTWSSTMILTSSRKVASSGQQKCKLYFQVCNQYEKQQAGARGLQKINNEET